MSWDSHWENVIPDMTYFRHTHIAYIHQQLLTEIIFRPYRRMVMYDDFLRLKQDLWQMLFCACEQDPESEAEYREHIDIQKVGIQVDYLLVVKDGEAPVAFVSGTFIELDLFYINCAMALPKYQHSGIGSILTAMLMHQAAIDHQRISKNDLQYVARTRNRRAARSLLRALDQGKISTEEGLTRQEQFMLALTARHLGCQDNWVKGICRNVYPARLPQGHGIQDERINQAFSGLGEHDGCFVIGRMNPRLIRYLLSRHVEFFHEKALQRKVSGK